jgi:hypothetical protein
MAVEAVLDARERLGVVFAELEAQRVVAHFDAGGLGPRAARRCIRAD